MKAQKKSGVAVKGILGTKRRGTVFRRGTCRCRRGQSITFPLTPALSLGERERFTPFTLKLERHVPVYRRIVRHNFY
jgi:hypothetical protein